MYEHIAQCPLEVGDVYTKSRAASAEGMQQVITLDFEERMTASVYPYLLDSAFTASSPTYSIWRTRRSHRVEPCVATCSGLPPVAGVAGRWPGQWHEWPWDPPDQ